MARATTVSLAALIPVERCRDRIWPRCVSTAAMLRLVSDQHARPIMGSSMLLATNLIHRTRQARGGPAAVTTHQRLRKKAAEPLGSAAFA